MVFVFRVVTFDRRTYSVNSLLSKRMRLEGNDWLNMLTLLGEAKQLRQKYRPLEIIGTKLDAVGVLVML